MDLQNGTAGLEGAAPAPALLHSREGAAQWEELF